MVKREEIQEAAQHHQLEDQVNITNTHLTTSTMMMQLQKILA
jgi:hypothetical protein